MSLVFGSAIITDDISGDAITSTTPVLVATTTAGTLINSFRNGSLIDGIVISTGDRILIKNQSSQIENGIYIVNVSGAPTRSNDIPAGVSVAGKTFQIIEGNVNADTTWTVLNDPPNDVVGIDGLIFAQIGKPGADKFVIGPGVSLLDRIALWSDTTGTVLKQSSGISLNDTNDISGINSLRFGGANVLSILADNQSSPGVVTIPNLVGISDTVTLLNKTQTLNNKTLTTPSISSILNGGTITIPSGTDTLVARATRDTLSNKNITDSSNNVHANGLNTKGSVVIINESSEPSLGQVLAADSPAFGSWTYQGWRSPVRAATTNDVSLSDNFNGFIIDDVKLDVGDRILLKNQSNAIENGIYVVGDGPGKTTRSLDMAIKFHVSMTFFYCTSGNISAGKKFLCTDQPGLDVVDQNDLTFIASGSGVTGPSDSNDFALARWNGTDGNALFNSDVTLDDNNNLIGLSSLIFGNGAVISSATQTIGQATVDIPNLSGVSGDMVITNAFQTLINKTITSGRYNQLLDTNGTASIILTATSNAVNQLTIANASSDDDPSITASGNNANVNLDLIHKGASAVQIKSNSSSLSGELRLFEDNISGNNYVGLRAPQSNNGFTDNTVYTFPVNTGINGQFLMTNGTGDLSWENPPGGGGSIINIVNDSATYTTTSTLYTTITSMTATPAAGSYYVAFNACGSIGTANTRFDYAIAVNNNINVTTVRRFSTIASQTINVLSSLNTIGVLTVDGSQTISINIRRNNGTGTISIFERILYLYKLF